MMTRLKFTSGIIGACAMLAGSAFGSLAGLEQLSGGQAQATEIRSLAPIQPASNVIKVQNSDALLRIADLEEQVRRLTGQVEDLTFQMLQMQEDFRKMQQDNELRFQELEEKQSDASGVISPDGGDGSKTVETAEAGNTSVVGDRLGKPKASETSVSDANSTEKTEGAPEGSTVASNSTSVQSNLPKPAPPLPPVRSTAPRPLGTLTFDQDGNVVDARRADEADGGRIASLPLPGVFENGVDSGIEAAEFGPTPQAVFEVGQAAIRNKRYSRAEGAFRAFLKAWPNDPREAQARYYLAESLFWQGSYFDAANIYLDTHNGYPDAPTAPDNLLGLGLALAGLNQREVACATYSEVLKQYPQATERLQPRVEAEQVSAKC